MVSVRSSVCKKSAANGFTCAVLTYWTRNLAPGRTTVTTGDAIAPVPTPALILHVSVVAERCRNMAVGSTTRTAAAGVVINTNVQLGDNSSRQTGTSTGFSTSHGAAARCQSAPACRQKKRQAIAPRQFPVSNLPNADGDLRAQQQPAGMATALRRRGCRRPARTPRPFDSIQKFLIHG